MRQTVFRRGLAVLVGAAATGMVMSGCASEDGPPAGQAELSSIQAQEAATTATVDAARQFTETLGPLYAIAPGPERLKWFEKAQAMACPGSATAKEYQKSKDAGWLERVQYVPGSRTEVVGAFPDKNPGDVLVVARTLGLTPPPGQKYYSQVSRLTIGDNAGKPCISKVEYL